MSKQKAKQLVVRLLLLLILSVLPPASGRRLAAGDFSDLNAILRTVMVSLPGVPRVEVVDNFLLSVDFAVNNIRCGQFSIGDLQVEHRVVDSKAIDFGTAVSDLAVTCEAEWQYWSALHDGAGTLKATASRADLTANVRFSSPGFEFRGPRSAETTSCKATVKLEIDDFDGPALLEALEDWDWFKGEVMDAVQSDIDEAVCDGLQGAVSAALESLLDDVDEMLAEFGDTPANTQLLRDRHWSLEERRAVEAAAARKPPVELLDFSAPSWLGNITQMAVRDYLNATDPDTGSLGVNTLVNKITGGTGRVAMSVADTKLMSFSSDIMDMDVTLSRMQVGGLNTFTEFAPFTTRGSATFEHAFAMNRLDAEAGFTVTLRQPSGPGALIVSSAGDQVENVDFTINLKQLETTVFTLVAIDEPRLWALQVGSVLESPIDCFLGQALFRGNVSGLVISVDDLEARVEGLLAHGVDYLFGALVDATYAMYRGQLRAALPNIFDIRVRDVINDEIADFLGAGKHCPVRTWPEGDEFFDFHATLASGDGLLASARDEVDKFLADTQREEGDPASVAAVNGIYVAPVTEAQSGTPGTWLLTDIQMKFARNARVTATASVEHLDTVHDINVLETTGSEPQSLHNSLKVGTTARPLTFTGSMTMKGFRVFADIHNALDVSLALEGMSVATWTDIFVDMGRVRALRLNQVQHFSCWLTTLRQEPLGVNMRRVELTFRSLKFDIDCVHCTSPLLQQIAANSELPAAQDEVSALLEFVLDMVTASLANNSATLRTILESDLGSSSCPDAALLPDSAPTATPTATTAATTTTATTTTTQPPTASPAEGSSSTVMVVVGGAVAGTLVLVLVLCFQRRARRRRYAAILGTKEHRRRLEKEHLVSNTRSLITSPAIPIAVRFAVPIVLLTNIAFFVTGHLALGAVVRVVADIAGERITIPAFFTFSLAQSTIDMWSAGAKELAIVIVLFSGVWPYTKMFIMIFLWSAPPRWVNPIRRGNIFQWLDSLGKWSMIDIFVLVMSMVSFALRIASPDHILRAKAPTLIPPELYIVSINVIPVWGLFANLIAQILSQLVSHVVIYYHRNVVAEADFDAYLTTTKADQGAAAAEEGQAHQTRKGSRRRLSSWIDAGTVDVVNNTDTAGRAESRERLMNHIFEASGGAGFFRLRYATRLGVLLMLAGATSFVVIGSVLPTFRVETNGLAGVFMNLGDPGSHRISYTLFDVVLAIGSQANGSVGVMALAAVFLLCSFVVPVAQTITLTVLWAHRLTLRMQKRLLVLNEILAAWQYMEVYLIAVIIAALQIGQISGFMVGDICDDFLQPIATAHEWGLISAKDAAAGCFDVEASAMIGAAVLLLAALLLALSGHFVLLAAHGAIEDREGRIKGFKVRDAQEGRHRSVVFRSLRRGCLRCFTSAVETEGVELRTSVDSFEGVVKNKEDQLSNVLRAESLNLPVPPNKKNLEDRLSNSIHAESLNLPAPPRRKMKELN